MASEDIDMDAPQISTLREDTTPEPHPARSNKFKLKLLVNEKGEGSKAGSTSSKHARADSEDDDEDDEDEEDQLIDDDDDDVPKLPPPTIPIPVLPPVRGSPAKRGSRGRGGGRRGRGGRGAAVASGPGVGVFETMPSESTSAQEPRAEVWDPMAAEHVYTPSIPGQPPKKKPGPPKGSTAQRAIRKKPSNEVHVDEAPLEGVPLPVYPLPSKPFPVQPPPKIGSGFAPVVPLDKSGKAVRRWRQVNREVRGIAGGRWFVKNWVGEKESEFAAAIAASQAAAQSAAGESVSVGGLTLPKLPSVSVSGRGRGRGGRITHESSRAGSAMPDSLSVHLAKKRGSGPASTPPAYASDPKYKKYTQQVEKCLNSFESVHEWADFIAFLKQLLKTLQSYQQFKEIPRKLVVAKRLSQCLNPALPNGVHQRALDVYSHVFAVLGSEGLQRDLALWSSGLFPFFEYASTAVKPTVLNLFDTHYLPLQAGLRPVMKSFILSLLPGLEEETGEYFDKVMGLMDRLAGTISQSFFFQNIWLVMLTTPPGRGTALTYLSKRLPPFKADEDITHIVGDDIGLMIRAFSAALEDDDLLVRRAALDILLQSLRIDGVAVRKAQADDRAILMRAATSVVLRRDLALNRRLYAWLLGPSESNQAQIEYYKAHSLELLSTTLRSEMFNPSPEYSQSRPFKIFISLLDKYEIGLPLTETLVYDSFQSLKEILDSGPDAGDDLSMTGSTLYEAVEPHALWNRLLSVVIADLTNRRAHSEGCAMVQYLLHTFHSHDEEIEAVHFPVVFSAILAALTIPQGSLHSRPALPGKSQTSPVNEGPLLFAYRFYGIDSNPPSTQSSRSAVPFTAAFEDVVSLSDGATKALLGGQADTALLRSQRDTLLLSLSLLDTLLSRQEDEADVTFTADWDPVRWLSTLLEFLNQKNVAFVTVDRFITVAIKIHHKRELRPGFKLDRRAYIVPMVNVLLRYLRPAYSAYHARAVNLIWSLERLSKQPHVESVIAESLSSRQPGDLQDACEAFGVLWRLTEDSMLPGVHLKIPMMALLETLRSDDPKLRRIGETWMRCSLKSYLRVLDPILFDLFDPSIRYSPTIVELNGKQLQGFVYDRPFDQRYVNHLLETLLSVVKFGGQGFSKIARTTPISRSLYSNLLQRLHDVSATFPDATYMDIIVSQLLMRLLQSEPKQSLLPVMQPFHIVCQNLSVDLLQALVARGEVDLILLQSLESAIVQKLYFCVHTGRLDLQNKLLHLLHSVITASIAGAEGRTATQVERSVDGISLQDAPSASRRESHAVHPLLVQTLVDGISTPSNRSLLQHWLDFITMTVPQFKETLKAVVTPLSDCVCRQLRLGLGEILDASAEGSRSDDIVSYATDADFLMLLTALERLTLLSMARVAGEQPQEDEQPADRNAPESGGLLGYVSNVFSSDGPTSAAEDPALARLSDRRCLHNAVRVLYAMWDKLIIPQDGRWGSQEESLVLIHSRARTRTKRVLEHLFRAHSSEVLEAVVDCWHDQVLARPDSVDTSSAYDLVDVLTANAQNAVHMLCESIACRTPGLLERTKRTIALVDLLDMTLFDFLEQYMKRLEGPLALQVWNRFLQLVKDLLVTLREFRPQAFAALKCFTVLADKVSQTTALDDRRLRKDLQETYGKLLDICVLSGRSVESGSWIRRTQRETLIANGRESPSPSLRTPETKVEEKNASSVSLPLPEATKVNYGADVQQQVNSYIASDALPNLRKFLVDSDKILAACNQIVYNIVNPALKGKARPLDLEDDIVAIIREMTRISVAMKAWRTPVVDSLNDNRCFNSSAEAGEMWSPMIKSLFDTDKTALPELLGKITTAPSANIFTNREYEMLLRSLNLRRLSYVILSADKNHFLAQLPSIQEKLVDTLRNVSAPIVQSEVYLCVRVLLCRLSPHNLSSFWPVILTELYRVFEPILDNVPGDGSEELGLVLSACKLLDLLLVLQTQEFQIHQWIFITDTVDAVYRPDDWFPEALLDHLAEVIGALPAGEHTVPRSAAHVQTPSVPNKPMRRPLLHSLRQIDSIRDLVPFFSTASISSYESVYHSGGLVDWQAVEKGLLEDLFEGR
ncbi:Dopey, N-terminal-domain-containing protein [Lenzites betulinus]|nr:Dopey, N-terminal-domain-containing protein [Lenzites betulinus]